MKEKAATCEEHQIRLQIHKHKQVLDGKGDSG